MHTFSPSYVSQDLPLLAAWWWKAVGRRSKENNTRYNITTSIFEWLYFSLLLCPAWCKGRRRGYLGYCHVSLSAISELSVFIRTNWHGGECALSYALPWTHSGVRVSVAVGLESTSIHYALEELKKVEETPGKQNTRGAISSSSPTEHLNCRHRPSLCSVVRELPGLRGSSTYPMLLLRHGTVSRIGHGFQSGRTLGAMTWSKPEEKM